jgi:PKD repeat protein
MNPIRHWPISLAVLGLLLLCWVLPTFAYYTPLQDVTAWIDADQVTVRFKVFDPNLAVWVEGSSKSPGQVDNLNVQQGIVGWRYRTLTYNLAVYDPGYQSWKIVDFSVSPLTEVSIQDGVVVMRNDLDIGVHCTYDPEQGAWKYIDRNHLEFHSFINKYGVAAYTLPYFTNFISYDGVGSILYDPKRGQWVKFDFSGQWSRAAISSLDINAFGTVTWIANGVNYVRGYNPDTGTWYTGQTLPMAAFAAMPAVGSGAVWSTDASIGATSWHYDFGDGTSSNLRSPLHTFANEGTYTVTQTVTGANGVFNTTTRKITITKTLPTGTISINGDALYTNSRGVTLQLAAPNGFSGVTGMRFSADGSTWPGIWTSYGTSAPYTLPAGDGLKTVYVQFQDGSGNISSTSSASITLDTTAPFPCSLAINGGALATNSTSITLAMSAQDPAPGSGLRQMRFSKNPTDQTSWSAWQNYETGPIAAPWQLDAGDGQKTVAAQFKDVAGNVAQVQSTIILDTTAPATCSVTINAGAPYTNSPSIMLTISAQDPGSGVQSMRFRTYDLFKFVDWTDWMAYATSKATSVFPGDGRKWVEAQFQDGAGNLSNIFSATIILDGTPPTDGALTAQGGDKQVSLSWSGFTDALSGINRYMLYYSTKPFTNLAEATKIYDGLALSYTHTDLKNGTKYYYRICAMDNAGNISPGVAADAVTKGKGGSMPFLLMLLGD